MEERVTTGITDSSETAGQDQQARSSYFRSVASYWEQLYEDQHLTAQIYQERKNVALSWIGNLGLPPGARVLDLGCGAGHTAVALARCGYQVEAVDCEPAMLEMTTRRAQESGVPLHVGIGDAHQLQFENATFDVVLALGVIPWLHSPKKALQEMRRVLKPGGLLIVSSDNRHRLSSWLDPIYNPVLTPSRNFVTSTLRRRGWMRMPDISPPRMQAPREFDVWLQETGLQLTKATTIGFGPFTFLGRTILPDGLGARVHGFLQKLAYAEWPLLRASGAHYLVAAQNPIEQKREPSRPDSRNRATESPEPKAPDVSTPVVLLGANTHGSLGIMRTLGRWGVPVHAVCSPPRGPASFSAFCKSTAVWDFGHARPEETASYLLDLAQWIGRRSILIATWDEMAIFTAEYYNVLKSAFIYPEQSPDLVRSLVDKQKMAGLARRFGVPTPDVVFPRSLEDIHAYMETARYPVMLKGIDGNKLKQRTGKKMVVVYSPRQLRDKYLEMQDAEHPNLMLQEYIPGGDDSIWMFNGYFNARSECLVAFTGKKLRQTPIHTGMTSLGICLPNDVVENTTKNFMRALGYRGILDIGYRFDARDGQYKVLDINPRIGATFRLFVTGDGMDVARSLYLDLTHQPVPECRQREGRKWFVELDFKSCLDYHREGALTFREWLRSLRGIEEAGYFAWDDLAPFWKLFLAAVRALLKGDRKANQSPNAARLRVATVEPTTLTPLESPVHNNGQDRSKRLTA